MRQRRRIEARLDDGSLLFGEVRAESRVQTSRTHARGWASLVCRLVTFAYCNRYHCSLGRCNAAEAGMKQFETMSAALSDAVAVLQERGTA